MTTRTYRALGAPATLAAWRPAAGDDPATVAPEDRYQDRGLLGKGGMGEVRRVYDVVLEREVAMKLVRDGLGRSRWYQRRFATEARVAAGLEHPGINPLYDFGRLADGRVYFTMRLVVGRTLSGPIREVHGGGGGGWTVRRLVEVVHRASQAVAFAHARGVTHLDLKPDNVMVGPFGEVVVMDWGLARAAPTALGARMQGRPGDTFAGSGTPGYLAPEQAEGEPCGPAADVHALGATLVQAVTGRLPFEGDTPFALLDALLCGRARLPPGDWPPALADLCLRALAYTPEERPADAGVFAAELGAWLEGERRREDGLALLAGAEHELTRASRLRAEAASIEDEARRTLAPLPAWADSAAKREAWRREDEAAALELEADRAETTWLQGVRAALNVAPDLPEAHRRLADHYRAQHAAAERERDRRAAGSLELLLRTHDREGRHAAYLAGTGALTLAAGSPGATARVYREVERDRRLVPELVDEWALPVVGRPLPAGTYRVVIEAPDRAAAVYPVEIRRGEAWDGVPPGEGEPRPVPLLRAGALGPEDMYVPPGWFWAGDSRRRTGARPSRRLWADGLVVRRFPVRLREYLAFINDLLDQGREEEALRWVPRERSGPQGGEGAVIPERDGSGHFVPGIDTDGDRWDPEWPAMQVDWRSAVAYAEWLAARTGQPWRLPGELEWEKAARGVDGRSHPWGNFLETSWACVAASHQGRPGPARVGDLPVDESPYGVRGVSGGVVQWCAEVWTPGGPETPDGRVGVPDQRGVPGGFRVTRGAHWESTESEVHLAAVTRYTEAARLGTIGFRVCRPVTRGDLEGA